MQTAQQQHEEYYKKAQRAAHTLAPRSSARYRELQQNASQNERNPLGTSHTFHFTGGSKLQVTLKPGMDPNKPNDEMMKLIDKAAKGKDFGNQRLLLKNMDPNAKWKYAPKTPVQFVGGHKLKEVSKYGHTDIAYDGAMGAIAPSLHGKAKYTLIGATDISYSQIGQGHIDLRTVGDGIKANGLAVSKEASLSGTLPAHTANATIVGGSNYGVAGPNANVVGSTLGGKTNASIMQIERTPEEFKAAMDKSRGYKLGASIAKGPAPKADNDAESVFQSAVRRKREEAYRAFPVPRAA